VQASACRVTVTRCSSSHLQLSSHSTTAGGFLQVGADRFKVPELLFQPALLTSFPGFSSSLFAAADAPTKGLHALVLDVIGRCDVDVRKDLYGGVLMTGGVAQIPNMRERLERELSEQVRGLGPLRLLTPRTTSAGGNQTVIRTSENPPSCAHRSPSAVYRRQQTVPGHRISFHPQRSNQPLSMIRSLKFNGDCPPPIQVSSYAPRVKVGMPNPLVERRFSVFIGGSILASLGSFQQMWLSKAEYDEHGPGLIHRKCP
jgi:actin-related protein